MISSVIPQSQIQNQPKGFTGKILPKINLMQFCTKKSDAARGSIAYFRERCSAAIKYP
jgi:hypothetical protein